MGGCVFVCVLFCVSWGALDLDDFFLTSSSRDMILPSKKTKFSNSQSSKDNTSILQNRSSVSVTKQRDETPPNLANVKSSEVENLQDAKNVSQCLFLEIFAGTAGLTAAVRKVGLHSDNSVSTTCKAPIVRLDLTTSHGVQLMWEILKRCGLGEFPISCDR